MTATYRNEELEHECPPHYWDWYADNTGCVLEPCAEMSDDYECWHETCDNDWCMHYERFGEDWYDNSCPDDSHNYGNETDHSDTNWNETDHNETSWNETDHNDTYWNETDHNETSWNETDHSDTNWNEPDSCDVNCEYF